ncbi:MAG: hypothetical protein GX181_07560 [Synergistaceae bacterium]|nr:hypothetical protein [Synergistaceae bacterium]
MNDTRFFPAGLHLLCAPSHREGEFILERRFAQVYAAANEISLDFDSLIAFIRRWCEAEGIVRDGQSASFSGVSAAGEYSGTVTRFRDEISVLIFLEGEGRKRYRVLGVFDDYSWLVMYQEPLTGEWRSWPGAARDYEGVERDRTDERSAREGFDWVCGRRIIARARLMRGDEIVAEYRAPTCRMR